MQILLDGVPQYQVIRFDTEEGWLIKYKMKDGQFVLDGSFIATEKLHGKVQVQSDNFVEGQSGWRLGKGDENG